MKLRFLKVVNVRLALIRNLDSLSTLLHTMRLMVKWVVGILDILALLRVAVKVIPKSKMTTAIAIEDVRREVKILQALTGHKNLVQFYDAFEADENVYIVTELCQGGELLDKILQRGGKYSEDDAKKVMVQILSVVAYCHLQGVVHRDPKPENFLFATKDESSPLKAIDFGLSDYVIRLFEA